MAKENILSAIKTNKIEFVDLIFGDLFGTVHHFTIPAKHADAAMLEAGLPFDGSSIRAWQSIDKSDMLLRPDTESYFIDPFRKYPTLCVFCYVHDPRTGQRYEKDPRSVLYKTVQYMKSLGIGDTIYMGPEPEFFVFDSISYASERNASFYDISSGEAPWTSGEEGSLGHKIGFKGGYFPMSPSDSLTDFRSEVAKHLETMGVNCEMHHHEVATAGQSEISIRFDESVLSADNVNILKYAIKNTAHAHGKTATFMPKPIFEDNGSGMHTHVSIWKGGKNTFSGSEYGSLSKNALYAIGGILKHGRSIQAFTNPTSNSFRRLIPGYEAPVKLAYSATNRSAAIRIPYVQSEAASRIEFRCPDSSGSPYLAFAAVAMAALDGIKNQIDPGDPMDKNIYDLPPEELATLRSTCSSQEESINELLADSSWLTVGDVFSEELIASYAEYRKEAEIEPLKLRPNPYEFELYYNI